MLSTVALYLTCATGLITTAESPWSNYSCYDCLVYRYDMIHDSTIDSVVQNQSLLQEKTGKAQRTCMHIVEQVMLEQCDHCTPETLHNDTDKIIRSLTVESCRPKDLCRYCMMNQSTVIHDSILYSGEFRLPLTQRSCIHKWQQATLKLCTHCTNATVHNDRTLGMMETECMILLFVPEIYKNFYTSALQMYNSCYKCVNSKRVQLKMLLVNEIALRGQFHNATFCAEFMVEQLVQHCHFNETQCAEVVHLVYTRADQYCAEIVDIDIKWWNTFAWIDLSVSVVAILSSVVTMAVLRNKDTVRMDALRTLLTALNVTDVLTVALNIAVAVLPGMQVRGLQTRSAYYAATKKYVDPVGAMLVTFATYLHVLITVERWLAYCRPLYYECSTRRLLANIACAAGLSVALHASTFLHYDIQPLFNTTMRYIEPAVLDHSYVLTQAVLYIVVQAALPLALIVSLNGHIAVAAVAAHRYKMAHGANEVDQSADLRLATMCACIALSFFLLNACGWSLRTFAFITRRPPHEVSMGLLYAGAALHVSGAFANDLLCFAFVRKYRLAVKGWLRHAVGLAKRAKHISGADAGNGTSTSGAAAASAPDVEIDLAEL